MLWWSMRWAVVVGAGVAFVSQLPPGMLPPGVVGGDAAPASAAVNAASAESFGTEMRVPAGPGGHFHLDIDVNSTPVAFLVDTGATPIVLSRDDAARVGLRPQPHEFTMRANTANGVVRMAPMTAREIRLGSFVAYDVAVVVNEVTMNESLLGMAFLKRLQGYEVRQGALYLRW